MSIALIFKGFFAHTLRELLSRHAFRLGALGLLSFAILWEIVSRSGWINPVMLPAPSVIARSSVELAANGELQQHVLNSLWRAFLGFAIGSILGLLLGVAMARLPRLHSLLNPLVQIFRAIPSLAFVPLAIFWFGIGETSKVILIAFGVFFPVWVNTYLGARDTNPLFSRAAASLGARGWRMLVFLILPAALPFIIAGTRIALGSALVLLVASELTGAQFGVGYLIQMSQQVFRVDHMFVGLITLGLLGFLFDYLFVCGLRKFLPWYGAENNHANGTRRMDGLKSGQD
ncbi:MAG: ABC transporter permease [Zoogloeaceae bacterium]|jgi:NitT/TauT family transport system permease protein/sulfonate transport system permease protein|nr:ABC transporter permease [Zoogloeaceae bacterium]